MPFHQFSDYEHHPLGNELRKRVSKIIWKMAIFRYSQFALFNAQLQIIEDLLALEESLRSCRDQASSLRRNASELAKAGAQQGQKLTDDIKKQIREIQEDAESFDYAVRILRYGRWLYRYIGDGIVWRAYRYNRHAIRALGAKEPVVFLSRKEGIEGEIRFFKAMRHLGKEWLPVMHDLTNCLRTGDFSLFKNGAFYELIELKIRRSGKQEPETQKIPTSAREKRQANRLQLVDEYMRTGDLGLLDESQKGGKSIKVDVLEKHHYEAITTVIRTARRHKYSFIEPERGLMYLASDTRFRTEEDALRLASERHPHVFETPFTFQGILPRFEEYHVSLPITAMELSARDMLDIIFGRISVMSFINFNCVEDFCRNNGVPLHFERGEKTARIVVDSKPYPGEVREGLWQRLQYEGLSLQSFSDLIRAAMSEASALPPNTACS